MSTRVVHRPARTVQPLPDQDPVYLTPPPTLPEGRSGGGLQSIIPLAGAGAAMSMMMFMRGSQFAALGAVIMLVSLSAAAVFFFSQRGQAGRKRRAASERYLDYLEDLREELRDTETWLQSASQRPDPPPAALLSVVQNPARLWERRRADRDFLRVRVGTGELAVRTFDLRDEGSLSSPTDPFMLSEGRSLVRRFQRVPGLPLCVDLDRAGNVAVVGAQRSDVLAVARAMLAQITALHAPDDVTLAVITGEHADDWTWVRWAPHAVPGTVSVDGPAPLLFPDVPALLEVMGGSLQDRAGAAAASTRHGGGDREARTQSRLVVIDDCFGAVARAIPVPDQAVDLGAMAVTVVHLLADRLQEPGDISRRITVTDDELTIQSVDADPPTVVRGTIDDAPLPLVEGLARELSPKRLSADSFDDGSGLPAADFADLLGVPEPTRIDLRHLWARRSERDFLRVPLGVDDRGKPVLLDLKESAQLGMGPHGLCVGATGSGKSELLRTLIMALALTHPPEQLSFVLADYKGGAAFAPFAALPHLAGLITNLSGDAALVERMYSSLEGEVRRRQEVLADAGKLADITEYNLRRDSPGGHTMEPLRHVVVVIDEFGELLTAKPEFIELFLQIGRIGRSIGMHLLLSSQRVEQGKLRGLDTYLSYRIGLRTLSEQESRTVLETPDAFHLPALPGNAYLKVDVTIYDRFRAAFVSGPLDSDTAQAASQPRGPLVKPMLSSANRERRAVTAEGSSASPRTTGPTLLGTVLNQIAGDHVPPVWLPPLPERVSLDAAAGDITLSRSGPVLSGVPDTAGAGLVVPIGVLDDPGRQWQGPWLVDLSQGGGNLLVLGGPGTGKSTTLRTLALGLALTQRPTDVGIYGVDLLGSGLRALTGLPHVGGVAGRDDLERVRRTFDEVHSMLLEREQIFARLQLDSVADLRAARAAGRLDELGSTEIVLLIDGYGQVLAEFEHLEGSLFDLLARGARFGIHVVATARRWNEPRAAQQVAFSRRLELRLTEPAESSIDPKVARTIPDSRPGRAMSSDKLVGQIALPRIDGAAEDGSDGLSAAATMIDSGWTGDLPRPIRVLPPVLTPADLAPAGDVTAHIPLGRRESDFGVATLDLFGTDQHLLVLGDSQTGKTNLLRVVATELTRRYNADEIVFAVFDSRRSLDGLLNDDYQGGYATNPALAERLASSVAGELQKRDAQGRIDGKPQPRVVLLIDDYDVLTAGTRPLSVLSPFLASGRDLGVHAVMSRRVAGASRGLFEPFTLAVRESGCLSVMFSGDRSEGQLFSGVRPTTMPPGRAFLVAPGAEARTIQTPWLEPGSSPR